MSTWRAAQLSKSNLPAVNWTRQVILELRKWTNKAEANSLKFTELNSLWIGRGRLVMNEEHTKEQMPTHVTSKQVACWSSWFGAQVISETRLDWTIWVDHQTEMTCSCNVPFMSSYTLDKFSPSAPTSNWLETQVTPDSQLNGLVILRFPNPTQLLP